MAIIVTGDDVSLPTELKKDGKTFSIDAGATIKAALISADRESTHIATVTVDKLAAGTDLANSLVIVEFPSESTGLIAAYQPALVEVQVDDGGKITWFADVDIEKGTIS